MKEIQVKLSLGFALLELCFSFLVGDVVVRGKLFIKLFKDIRGWEIKRKNDELKKKSQPKAATLKLYIRILFAANGNSE